MIEGLKRLIDAFVPSGMEDDAAHVIMGSIKRYADEIYRDSLGNVIAVKKGRGKGRVMISAHMDQIGLMVKFIDENGFLRFADAAGLEPHSILYHKVIFKNGTRGIIAREEKGRAEKLDVRELYIDIGALNREDAEKKVRIGDFCILKPCFEMLGKDMVSGTLWGKLGCYILMDAVAKINESVHDLYFVFTSQGSTNSSGAATSSYAIQPDNAIIVGMTDTGDTPGSERKVVKIRGGPAIKVMDSGVVYDPVLKDHFVSTALKHGIKHQMDVSHEDNAESLRILTSKSGVKTGGIAVPARYMNSPNQAVDISDVNYTVDLLVKAIEELK